MASYDFATLWSDADGVFIISTDQSELATIITEIKKKFPALREKRTATLPTGQRYFVHIDRIKDVDEVNLMWWVIKQLCSRGWEPLGLEQISGGWIHHQFRRTAP